MFRVEEKNLNKRNAGSQNDQRDPLMSANLLAQHGHGKNGSREDFELISYLKNITNLINKQMKYYGSSKQKGKYLISGAASRCDSARNSKLFWMV